MKLLGTLTITSAVWAVSTLWTPAAMPPPENHEVCEQYEIKAEDGSCVNEGFYGDYPDAVDVEELKRLTTK